MKSFTVTGIKAGFAAGMLLALTPEQASPRAHKLTQLGPAEVAALADRDALGDLIPVRVDRPIEFKRGETIAVIGDGSNVGKRLLMAVADAASPAAQATRAEVGRARAAARKVTAEREAKARGLARTTEPKRGKPAKPKEASLV